MKRVILLFLIVLIISSLFTGCSRGKSAVLLTQMPTSPATALTGTSVKPLPTQPQPVLTQAQPGATLEQDKGGNIIITSTNDGGAGTLRQALSQAKPGETIIFDPAVFPPRKPATIYITTALPPIEQGYVTIDASNAGVILEGSNLPGRDKNGLDILSDWNTVRGLQIVHFSGSGIALSGGHHNLIGGDRSLGVGPAGQGNLINGNNVGIGIWNRASANTITGNLIGTDVSGGNTQENNDMGVSILECASGNIIGPDNVIAYNASIGVSVIHRDSVGNTITRNSIHSNGVRDIQLEDGGNDELTPPRILGYDLTKGMIEGFTCADCLVEIFSTASDHNMVYEGQASADESGYFYRSVGGSFKGHNLIVTATNGDGSTSTFSHPTSGETHTVVLQDYNTNRKILLQNQDDDKLADNQIGDMVSLMDSIRTTEEAERYLATSTALGFTWKRLSLDYFDWSEVISEHPPVYSRFEVNPIHDQLISDLADNGVTLVYGLVFWDEEIEAVPIGYSRFKDKAEIQRYLDYVRFIVMHFKGRIEYYEILNESFFGEGSTFTQQNIELADYINLVRLTAQVIHAEDPIAKVVAGPAPGIYEKACFDYQMGMLSSNVIMPIVDAVSWHPGPYPVDYSDEVNYIYQFPQTVNEIRDTAEEQGFTGIYIAEELQWPTAYNPSPSEAWNTYAEILSAKYYARGIIEHQGLGMVTLLAGTAYEGDLPKMDVIRNLTRLLAGAEPMGIELQVQSESGGIVSYPFEYTNGDYLIALWQDGIAVEEIGSGVEVTLSFDNIEAERVVGIDVLHSLTQELIFNNNSGDVVIGDLLVKDYPLILQLKVGTDSG